MISLHEEDEELIAAAQLEYNEARRAAESSIHQTHRDDVLVIGKGPKVHGDPYAMFAKGPDDIPL